MKKTIIVGLISLMLISFVYGGDWCDNADLNRDGGVDDKDLKILSDNYGCIGICDGDINGDGKVNVGDLGILGANHGRHDCKPQIVCETSCSGGGNNKYWLSYMLWGNYNMFEDFEYYNLWLESYIDNRLNQINNRLDMIEAKVNFNYNGRAWIEEDLILEAALIKSKRTGIHVYMNGFDCNGNCVRLSNIE